MNKTFFGFYSATAADKYGEIVYLDTEGKEVVVTAVYDDIEKGVNDYQWPDAGFVCEVVKFVRKEDKFLDNFIKKIIFHS